MLAYLGQCHVNQVHVTLYVCAQNQTLYDINYKSQSELNFKAMNFLFILIDFKISMLAP